jgi:hypothetical protein
MTTTLQESKGQYRLTIHKKIVEFEGFKKGQKFNIIKVILRENLYNESQCHGEREYRGLFAFKPC